MQEIRRWHAPGREQSKDKPFLIFPAAGWYHLASKKGFAGPGWLVAHPGDPVTGPGRKVGYYMRNQDEQLVLAWAEDYDSLEIDSVRREIIIRAPRSQIQVVQYIDDVGPRLQGFVVEEWKEPRAQPYPASEAVVRAIAEWEATERR